MPKIRFADGTPLRHKLDVWLSIYRVRLRYYAGRLWEKVRAL